MRKPFKPLNAKEKAAFTRSLLAAKDKAGSYRKLARILTEMAHYKSVSHIGIHGWRVDYRVPPQWALLLDEYCEDCHVLDLCPYLREWSRKAA